MTAAAVKKPPTEADQWAALAAPFSTLEIERLPKQVSRDDTTKGKCEAGSRITADGYVCGGWHARSVHLDYVGPQLQSDAPNPRTRIRGAHPWDRIMYRTAAVPSGCWEFRGSKNPKGYPHVKDFDGRLEAAYRVTYRTVNGPIPDNLEIDHLCSNRACVNPAHLEAVTHRENTSRGRGNQNRGKPECDHGHPFNEANTRIDADGKRRCRTCCRARTRAYRARQEAMV